MVVTLKDGTMLEKEVLTMKGEAEKPISDRELKNKVKLLIETNPNEAVRKYAQLQLK